MADAGKPLKCLRSRRGAFLATLLLVATAAVSAPSAAPLPNVEDAAPAIGSRSDAPPRDATAAALSPVDSSTQLSHALRNSTQRLARLVGKLPLFLVAMAVTLFAWRLGSWTSRCRLVTSRLTRNPLLGEMVKQALKAAFLLAGVMLGLEILNATSLATALLGYAGVVGIALGFALRDLLENYIASVLLSLRQPFSPNDMVLIDGHEGTVVGMNSRATVLMTPDGNHLRLPNAQVFKSVMLNYTRNGRRRFDFTLTVMPACDVSCAMQHGLAQVTSTPDVLTEPAPFVQIQEASPDGTVLQFFAWVDQRSGNFGGARSEALRRTLEHLRKVGFDLGPPKYRLDARMDTHESQPATPIVDGPPVKAGETHAAIQAAVEKTREEMGDRDLLRNDARKE